MEDLDQSPRVNPAHESSENEPPEAKSEEEESIQDLFRMKREVRKAEIEELLAIPIKAPVFLGSKDDLTIGRPVSTVNDRMGRSEEYNPSPVCETSSGATDGPE